MLFVVYHLLSAIVEFIYYLLYISYYFGLTDDTYSVHVCLVLSPTCFLLCFPFMKCNDCTYDFWFPSALASLPHFKLQGELSIQARVGFSRSWHDVLYFRKHTILFFILVYSIFLDFVLGIRCPWCDDYQILGW